MIPQLSAEEAAFELVFLILSFFLEVFVLRWLELTVMHWGLVHSFRCYPSIVLKRWARLFVQPFASQGLASVTKKGADLASPFFF